MSYPFRSLSKSVFVNNDQELLTTRTAGQILVLQLGSHTLRFQDKLNNCNISDCGCASNQGAGEEQWLVVSVPGLPSPSTPPLPAGQATQYRVPTWISTEIQVNFLIFFGYIIIFYKGLMLLVNHLYIQVKYGKILLYAIMICLA